MVSVLGEMKGLKTLAVCPLCQSGPGRHVYDLNPLQVHRCASCGLEYLNPCLDGESMAASYENLQSLSALNDFYEGYAEYGDISRNTKTIREFHQCLDALERYLESGSRKRLLEIGCGSGFFLAVARERGWEVQGVESSAHNVKIAKEKFSLDLHQGLFEEYAGGLGAYDAVIMRDVLEHRFDPHAFLSHALNMLRPGGLLLIAVPHHDSMLRYASRAVYYLSAKRLDQGLRKAYLMEHTAYYNRRTLGRLFKDCGVKPLETFQSSTDLARYTLSPWEKAAAWAVLTLGKITGMQNRLIALGRKTDAA